MTRGMEALMMFTAVFTLVSYIFAIVYAITQWKRVRRPTNYLLTAFGILAGWWLFRTLGLMAIANSFGPASVGQAAAVVGVVGAVIHAICLALFVAATYVDRPNQPNREPDVYLAGDQQPPRSDPNPFVTPS